MPSYENRHTALKRTVIEKYATIEPPNTQVNELLVSAFERRFSNRIWFFNPSKFREIISKIVQKTLNFSAIFSDFQRFSAEKSMILSFRIDFFIIPYWKNRVLGPISHVEKPFFCCIFTISARIRKIIINLKPPFEGGYGQLIQSGAWRNYGGVLFHYCSKVGFKMMAF